MHICATAPMHDGNAGGRFSCGPAGGAFVSVLLRVPECEAVMVGGIRDIILIQLSLFFRFLWLTSMFWVRLWMAPSAGG